MNETTPKTQQRPDPKKADTTHQPVPLSPSPRKPHLSQTEVDKERADWEGMVPEKPTEPDEGGKA